MLPCGMQSKKFPHELVITGNDWETAKQDVCRIEHAISDTAFRKLKKKVQGIAHVGPALHNELSAPERGKKKSWSGPIISRAHFGNTMLTGGFDRIKAAVSFTLKRDDALTLALTAAYKEGAAHDTT